MLLSWSSTATKIMSPSSAFPTPNFPIDQAWGVILITIFHGIAGLGEAEIIEESISVAVAGGLVGRKFDVVGAVVDGGDVSPSLVGLFVVKPASASEDVGSADGDGDWVGREDWVGANVIPSVSREDWVGANVVPSVDSDVVSIVGEMDGNSISGFVGVNVPSKYPSATV